MDGDLPQAVAGQAITLTLEDEIDISRGDLLAGPQYKPHYVDRFEAKLVWLHEDALLPGRSYLVKAGSSTVPAQVDAVNYKVNVNSLQQEPGKTLELNEVGVCTISANSPIPFDSYPENHGTGSFILIDRLSNATVGAGMIDRALERATDSHWQDIDVDKQAHAALKRQTPKVLWLTGLPGAGKSTVANLIEKKLYSLGKHTYILDGDNLRHNLNRDLGYDDADQVEHIRRIAEAANILVEAGLIVIAPVVAPFRNERRMAREIFAEGEFIEVYLDTPLAICEQRDQTGAYQKVRSGELSHIAGIDSTYEPPESPEYIFSGNMSSPEEIALTLVEEVFEKQSSIEWEI